MIALLAAAVGCSEPPPPPVVILVSLDTVRADRLGAWGNPRGLTPNLDRFAAEAVVFDQAYAQSNETRYSHASLFTSRYPSELGPLDGGFSIPAEVATLAGVLAAYGWQTAGFVGGGHLAASYGVNAGFATWDDAAEWGSLHDTTPRALNWLDAQSADAPIFLFVHGYDAHDRYLKPTPFGYALTSPVQSDLATRAIRVPGLTSIIVGGRLLRHEEDIERLTTAQPRFDALRGPGALAALGSDAEALTGADTEAIRNVYDSAVAYADAAFGVLMAGLDARNMVENATIIVVSDHGESLGEDGSFHHRFALTDDTLRVPLLIRLPGGAHGGRHVTGVTELTDVLPTVLDLTGEVPPARIRGVSLRASLESGSPTPRTVAFSESALRIVSVRGADARLTAHGLGVDNAAIASLIAATPVNGVTLAATGNPAGTAALKSAMVAWRREIEPHPRAAAPPSEHTSPQNGYWQVNP